MYCSNKGGLSHAQRKEVYLILRERTSISCCVIILSLPWVLEFARDSHSHLIFVWEQGNRQNSRVLASFCLSFHNLFDLEQLPLRFNFHRIIAEVVPIIKANYFVREVGRMPCGFYACFKLLFWFLLVQLYVWSVHRHDFQPFAFFLNAAFPPRALLLSICSLLGCLSCSHVT